MLWRANFLLAGNESAQKYWITASYLSVRVSNVHVDGIVLIMLFGDLIRWTRNKTGQNSFIGTLKHWNTIKSWLFHDYVVCMYCLIGPVRMLKKICLWFWWLCEVEVFACGFNCFVLYIFKLIVFEVVLFLTHVAIYFW